MKSCLSLARLKAPAGPGTRLLIPCYLSVTLARLKAPLGLNLGSIILFFLSVIPASMPCLLAYIPMGSHAFSWKASLIDGAVSLGAQYAEGYLRLVNASRGGVQRAMNACCHLPEFHSL